jgi:hypothetical protein
MLLNKQVHHGNKVEEERRGSIYYSLRNYGFQSTAQLVCALWRERNSTVLSELLILLNSCFKVQATQSPCRISGARSSLEVREKELLRTVNP